MDHPAALAFATTLRSVASSIRDTEAKKLQKRLGEPGGAARQLDKSGAEIAVEAMQLATLMHGHVGLSEQAALEQMRKHGGLPLILSTMRSHPDKAGLQAAGKDMEHPKNRRGVHQKTKHVPDIVHAVDWDALQEYAW